MGSAVYSKIALFMFTHQNLWIHIANFGALAYEGLYQISHHPLPIRIVGSLMKIELIWVTYGCYEGPKEVDLESSGTFCIAISMFFTLVLSAALQLFAFLAKARIS